MVCSFTLRIWRSSSISVFFCSCIPELMAFDVFAIKLCLVDACFKPIDNFMNLVRRQSDCRCPSSSDTDVVSLLSLYREENIHISYFECLENTFHEFWDHVSKKRCHVSLFYFLSFFNCVNYIFGLFSDFLDENTV